MLLSPHSMTALTVSPLRSLGPLLIAALALVSCSDDDGVPASAGTPPGMTRPSLTDNNGGQPLVPGESIAFTVRADQAVLAPSVTAMVDGERVGGASSARGAGAEWDVTYTVEPGVRYGALSFEITLRNLEGAARTHSYTPTPAIVSESGWGEPAWEEPFDGSALNTDSWNVQTGDGTEIGLVGWGNNELQTYSAAAISLANGMLTITASALASDASPDRGDYQSARINTSGKRDFRYGRVEVRAHLPSGQGTWPAIWMLPTDNHYGIWPLSGEIDIMEAVNLGVGGNTGVSGSLHYGLPPHGADPDHSYTSVRHDPGAMQAPQDGFHVYAAEWEAGEIRFYFDGAHYATMTADETWHGVADRVHQGVAVSSDHRYQLADADAPFDRRFHILLNLAIGGNPVGAPPAPADFPDTTFMIDYVRVYECSPRASRCVGTLDPRVRPTEDPRNPSFASMKVYDGPNLAVAVPGTDLTNTLMSGGYMDLATVTQRTDATDASAPDNFFWNIDIVGASGNVGNAFLTSGLRSDAERLESGFEFTGANGLVGDLALRMRVNRRAPQTGMLVKLDSGSSNLGEVTLGSAHLVSDAEILENVWQQYSIPLAELSGVILENVQIPFVFEATATNVAGLSVNVDIDDIYIHIACREAPCSAGPRLKSLLPDQLVVFDDAVDLERWDLGVGVFDAVALACESTADMDTCGNVNWEIVADESRGRVLEIRHGADEHLSLTFVQSSGVHDLSQFAAGEMRFDIRLVNQGTNASPPPFFMRVDCDHPCSGGDQDIGVVGADGWETVRVAIASAPNGLGMYTSPSSPVLDLTRVNTPLAVWPEEGMQAGVEFQIDHIVWDVATDIEPPPPPPELPDQLIAFGDDGPDFGRWNNGIGVYDDAIPGVCASPSNMGECGNLMWEVVSAGGVRGDVLEVTVGASTHLSTIFLQSSVGQDLSKFANGELRFDIQVVSPGSSASSPSFFMQVDCGHPCTTGGRDIGAVGSDGWETVKVSVVQLVRWGLDLEEVNTALVVWPAAGMQAGVIFWIDNIVWDVNCNGEHCIVPPSEGVTLLAGRLLAGGESLVVYDDALAAGYSLGSYGAGGGGNNPVGSADTDAVDPDHGKVIQFTNSHSMSVAWVESSTAVDQSAYSSGVLVFDLLVEAEPQTPATLWQVKLESEPCPGACVSSTGDGMELTIGNTLALGGLGNWNTVVVEVAALDIQDAFHLDMLRRIVVSAQFGMGAGAAYQLDNIVWYSQKVAEVAPPLTLFGDSALDGYTLQDFTGNTNVTRSDLPTSTATVDPEGHGAVFRVQVPSAVTQRVSWIGNAQAEDFSAFASGTLSFDILVNTQPTSSEASWQVKIESEPCPPAVGCTGGVDAMFAVQADLTVGQWSSFTLPVMTLATGAFDLSRFRNVVFFNEWDHAAGADFEIDNVVFNPAP